MLGTLIGKVLAHYGLLLAGAVMLWLILTGYGGYRLFFARWRKLEKFKRLQEQLKNGNQYVAERAFWAAVMVASAILLGAVIANAPPPDSDRASVSMSIDAG